MPLTVQYITTIPTENFADYPLSKSGLRDITVVNNCDNIAKGYNEAPKRADFLIFIRPECTVLPAWKEQIQSGLTTINFMDGSWGVAGCISTTVNNSKEVSGFATINGKQRGIPFHRPFAVPALDDCLLIVKKRDNVIFDESSTCIGFDICAKYANINRKSYVINAPVTIENIEKDDEKVESSVEYLKNKYTNLVDFTPFHSSRNMAVLLQLYYIDMWPEFASYLSNIKSRYDLYVTMTEDSPETEKAIKEFHNKAIILKVANRGMDIGQTFEAMQFIDKMNLSYNCYLKLHTKKSISKWREELIKPICNSPTTVENCLNILKLSHVGMIGAKKWLLTMHKGDVCANNNYSIMQEFTKDWKNAGIYDNQFIGGTMFWVNGEIWEKFFAGLNIESIMGKFKEGHYKDDDKGTYAHSFERLFGAMVRENNKVMIGL